MSGLAPASSPQPGSAEAAAELWHRLLRPDVELTPAFLAELNARMRAERLTFGERIHCPFLRPFFLLPKTSSAFAWWPRPSRRWANAW